MWYFLKRQYFLILLSLLIAVRYFISFAFAMFRLHYFFGSGWYATSFFLIILDGVFIEPGSKMTKNIFIAKKLHFQLLIELRRSGVLENPVQTCSFFANGIGKRL